MAAEQLLLRDLVDILNRVADFSLAESWDNVGLMVGDPQKPVNGILVALDPTEEVIDEALAKGCDTIISHHPLIFEPLKSVRLDMPTGRTVARCIADGVAVISCHTNLDVIHEGVSDQLGHCLGLNAMQPLAGGVDDAGNPQGFGRIGTMQSPLAGRAFLAHARQALDLPVIGYAGELPEKISRVAVCGGSGSSLAEAAFAAGAEVYISGEIKHSTARWAEAVGFCVLDCGHYATEKFIVPALAGMISEIFAAEVIGVPVSASSRQTAPFRCYPHD